MPGSLFSPELVDWYAKYVRSDYSSVAFPDSTHKFISDNPDKFSDEMVKIVKNKRIGRIGTKSHIRIHFVIYRYAMLSTELLTYVRNGIIL